MNHYEKLMKYSLNSNNLPRKRAEAFNKIYYDYVKEKGDDTDWDKFREKLRNKFLNKLSEKQKKSFGLTEKDIKNSQRIINKNISKKQKSKFPIDLFYAVSFSIIRKNMKKNSKILDIGYGDYPTFVSLLNKNYFDTYGIEPFPKYFDNKRSFKASMKNFPRKLEQKYDLILINMVYSINYTYYFRKNFEWELKHKKDLVKKLASLITSKGYLILVDDLGTIFQKNELEKYFKIILSEKDVPAGSGRITLLRKE